MRVLYLSYDGLTDGLGRSQVLPYIIGLEEKGHKFTIISFEKKERFKKDEHAIRTLLKGKNITWIPLIYTSTPPILSTIYDVWQLRKQVKRLHSATPFDLVHCRSYITSLVGLWLKRKQNVPFAFDMRAFYADERVDGRLWNIENPVYKAVYDFFKSKEKEFLQDADYTISLTEKGREIIHSWLELKGQPLSIQVIPCCADLQHFSMNNVELSVKERLRIETGLRTENLVVTYLGSIGTWYMLPEMLDFFKVLLAHRPEARLLFITQDEPSTIMNTASEKGIPDDCIVIRPAGRDEVPAYLSLANVALFFIRPVFSKSGSSPTKHGEMLGMGLPVIANAGVGDVEHIICSSGTGAVVQHFNEEEYQKVVSTIDELLAIPKTQLLKTAEEFYSLETGVECYHEVYLKLARTAGKTTNSSPKI
jgi:glycosyltransferase involved in cell wall biosynthesis